MRRPWRGPSSGALRMSSQSDLLTNATTMARTGPLTQRRESSSDRRLEGVAVEFWGEDSAGKTIVTYRWPAAISEIGWRREGRGWP